jgi:hypothetical protein
MQDKLTLAVEIEIEIEIVSDPNSGSDLDSLSTRLLHAKSLAFRPVNLDTFYSIAHFKMYKLSLSADNLS